MHLLEIILFASIAAFFLLRLYSVLGKRTGHSPRPEAASPDAPTAPSEPAPHIRPAFTGPAAAGMEDIRRRDAAFDPNGFVEGARKAYEMIIAAYADGDREALGGLLTSEVHMRYAASIDAREEAGHRQVSDLIRVARAEIEHAAMDGDVAKVSVLFESDLASGLTDADGATIDGDPTRINRVREVWTFQRDVTASNPNWLLGRVKPA